jgi:hypothetical protein
MRKYSITLFTLVTALAMASSAMATTINFGCPGSLNGGAACTTSPSTTPLSTWNQGGFTVTSEAGSWYFNHAQGNPPPGISTAGTGTYTVQVAANGGGLFDFSSVDLGYYASGGSLTYSIVGIGGATPFDLTGTLSGGACSNLVAGESCSFSDLDGAADYFTITDTSFLTDGITALDITIITSGNSGYVDNIDVLTPEPASLLLLGTGLLGLAFVTFRKFKSSDPASHA